LQHTIPSTKKARIAGLLYLKSIAAMGRSNIKKDWPVVVALRPWFSLQ